MQRSARTTVVVPSSPRAEASGLRGLLGRTAGGMDVALIHALQDLVDPASYRIEDLPLRLDVLTACEKVYSGIAPERFYAEPPPIEAMRQRLVGRLVGGQRCDATWPSGYIAHTPEERARFDRWPENATGHARLLLHERPAPAIVCVHGYRGGAFHLEERLWPASLFFELGLDVALFTLPFHGLRSPTPWYRIPLFPHNREVALTNEALGQSIWDLRRLIAWLRLRGAPRVGVAGMSLGGYVSALLATVEPRIDFVVPFIPLAEFTDSLVAHLALRGRGVPLELIAAAHRSMDLCRPLARRPLVPGERVLVIAAEHDRITGRAQAEKLAAHFQAGLVTFPGAHMLQVGRGPALRAMARFLVDAAGLGATIA